MHSERETGTVRVLFERLVHERLPRALEIMERLESGECLSDIDLEFMERVFSDANENKGHWATFPEYTDVLCNIVDLYHKITAKALENEQKRAE
jgi:hypothetical protein